MKFVSVRDFRGKSDEVWRKLNRERELVITDEGKPIAIVSATDEEHFEQTLRERQQARALCAARALQRQAERAGRPRVTARNIEKEIREARKSRHR